MRNFHFSKICALAATAAMIIAGSAVAGDYCKTRKNGTQRGIFEHSGVAGEKP